MDDTFVSNTHAQCNSFWPRNCESEQLHDFNVYIVKRTVTNCEKFTGVECRTGDVCLKLQQVGSQRLPCCCLQASESSFSRNHNACTTSGRATRFFWRAKWQDVGFRCGLSFDDARTGWPPPKLGMGRFGPTFWIGMAPLGILEWAGSPSCPFFSWSDLLFWVSKNMKV